MDVIVDGKRLPRSRSEYRYFKKDILKGVRKRSVFSSLSRICLLSLLSSPCLEHPTGSRKVTNNSSREFRTGIKLITVYLTVKLHSSEKDL